MLALLVGACIYVLRVARTRTDVYAQALEAQAAGRLDDSERMLRSLLDAKPGDDQVRLTLIDVLSAAGRVPEAETLARFWIEEAEAESLGMRALCRLALRRQDGLDALYYARMIADTDPLFSHSIIMEVHDAIGTPASLERAVRAAEALATLAGDPVMKAQAWLYAAETTRTLEGRLSEGRALQTMRARREHARTKARAALQQSRAWKERLPRARALMAAIQLLAIPSEEPEASIEEIEEYTASGDGAHRLRLFLLSHRIANQQYAEAEALLLTLEEAPPIVLARAAAALTRASRFEAVIRVLRKAGTRGPLLERVLAQALLHGDETQQAEALDILERLALRKGASQASIRNAYMRIRDAGDWPRAEALLTKTASANPRMRFFSLVEQARRAADGGEVDLAGALLSQLGDEATDADVLEAAVRLQTLGGSESALGLLNAALAARHADSALIRLMRASTLLKADGASAVAMDDLRAIAQAESASGVTLLGAATLAVKTTDQTLTGLFVGRALAEGAPADPAVTLLLRLCALDGAEARETAAQGIRLAKPDSAWIEAVADAVVSGDATSLRTKPGVGGATGRPQPTHTILQIRLATRDRDWQDAEAHARKLVTLGTANSRARLGQILLDAGKYEGVLSLYTGDGVAPEGRKQRITAFRRLDRIDKAIEESRLFVRESKGSDDALILLSEVLREIDPDAALASLAHVVDRPAVDLFRAGLLEQRGEPESAVRVYEDLLAGSGDRNVAAWTGLARVRIAQGRQAAFVIRVKPVLGSSSPPDMPKHHIATLALLRAQAREGLDDFDRALEDYKRALRYLPNNVTALNNAAWIIAAQIPWHIDEQAKRMQEALVLADRAVERAPQLAPVHHTRAKVLLKVNRLDDAVRAFDRAAQLTKKMLSAADGPTKREQLQRRLGRYLLDKAGVLERMEKPRSARSIYEQIQTELEGTPEGERATLALERLGS